MKLLDLYPEKILKFLAPRLKKKNPYPGFNIRMLAVTIDILLFTLVFTPIFNIFTKRYQPLPPANLPQEPGQMIHALAASGWLASWLAGGLIQFLCLLALIFFFWQWRGATPGKELMRLKIVDIKTGNSMTPKQNLLRLVGYILSMLPGVCLSVWLALTMPVDAPGTYWLAWLFASCLSSMAGFLWISVNKKRLGWHDKFAGTQVIYRAKPIAPAVDPSDSPAP